jgi:hypothetical protein
MRCSSYAPDVRLHTTADIQQQDNVNRHPLTLKIPDLLLLSVYSQDEILNSEISNGMVFRIHYLSVYASHQDITTVTLGSSGLSSSGALS